MVAKKRKFGCLSEDDEECEREAIHDEHTLALFYHLVDVTVKARHDEDDRAVADCFNSSSLIDRFFYEGCYRSALLATILSPSGSG